MMTGSISTGMASTQEVDSATLMKKQKLQDHIASNISFPSFINDKVESVDVKIRFKVENGKVQVLEIDGDDNSVKEYVAEEMSMMRIPEHLRSKDTYKVILRFRVA